jgi:AcrR family transcriptional regulator
MPRRTEDLEIRMIEEAIATIEQDGEAAIRVRDICEACSAREPALYLRFGSRAGLIVAAQAERYRRSIEILVTRSLFALNETIETGDLSTLLKRAVDWGFDPDLRNRLTRINVIGSSVSRPALADAIAEVNNEAIHELAGGVERARDAGLINPIGTPEAIAAWYLGTATSRSFVEFKGSAVTDDTWNDVFIASLTAVLLGGDRAATLLTDAV